MMIKKLYEVIKMKILINHQNKRIPVYFSTYNKATQKAINNLLIILDKKIKSGKKSLKTCLDNLISIEIEGCEAILHTRRESDTLALSLF